MVRSAADEMGNFRALFVFTSFLLLAGCGSSKEITKRSLMQRVFGRGPGESMASVFLNHKPTFEIVDHSWGNFRVLPQFDVNVNFQPEEGRHRVNFQPEPERHRFDVRHQPLKVVKEIVNEDPVTSDRENYQGFNILPHYIRYQDFYSAVPEETFATFTSKPQFANFLPQFDKTNSFNSEPATFTSSVNIGASEASIFKSETQSAKFLPQFDRTSSFNSEPATFTSAANVDTSDSLIVKPTMEVETNQSPAYGGFRLLPSYDNWNNFRVASPVIVENKFQEVSPSFSSMESMPKNENRETVQYTGFRVLPNYDGIHNFRTASNFLEVSPVEQPTIQAAEPVVINSMESMPKNVNSETVQYTGFRLLPNYDGINNFRKALDLVEVSPVQEPIIRVVEPVINSMESMPKNENNAAGSIAYSGFRVLPNYDGINNFRKDFIVVNPSPVVSETSQTFDMPSVNVENPVEKNENVIHYAGFKLLPNFGPHSGFLNQNLFNRFNSNPIKSTDNFSSLPTFDHNQLSPIEHPQPTVFRSTPVPSTTPAPIAVTQQYNSFKFLPGFDHIQDFSGSHPSAVEQMEPQHFSTNKKNPEIRQQFHTLDVKVESFTPSFEQANLFRKTDRNGMKVLVKVRKLNKVPSGTPDAASSVPSPKIFPIDRSISTVLCDENNNLQSQVGCTQRLGKKLPISVSSVADLPLDPHAIFDGARLPNKNSFGQTVDPDMF